MRGFAAAMRKEHSQIRLRSQIERFSVGRQQLGFLLSHGIGDHIIALGFADAFEEARGEPLGYVVGRGSLAFLAELYSPQRLYIPMPAGARQRDFEDGLRRTRLLYAHFPKLQLPDMIGYRGLTFLDAYRCRLRLPDNVKMRYPRAPSAKSIDAATVLLQREGLRPGKTVMLCTEAKSLDAGGLLDRFWTPLAEKLQQEGLDVKVNDNPQLSERLGLGHAPVALDQWRPLVAACGHVIAFRSGLSELVLNLDVRHSVVFPLPKDRPGFSLMRGFPVGNCGHEEDILHIECDPDSPDRTVAELLERHLK
ncbi:hypothetical protein [Hoeflea poritis]|uniref:Uncharacterized protein n=1 Tax=Hoeflea poritis TaxID=2993659 RepID=A0ABT4VVU5_9HYPH|nr:hypothetical protein [Hoeflea poritis]MDA4848137.1 hypothetical protein [Hoeflea poritis]